MPTPLVAQSQETVHKSQSMETAQKISLLENVLERAAVQLGDVTRPVMTRYYRLHPEAEKSFAEHGLGSTAKLEAEMVESVLYCIMNWHERPQEIRIMFGSTVPHHEDTLHVTFDWFAGLIDAGVAVIAETIPVENRTELQVIQDIGRDLIDLVEKARV